MKKKVLCTLMIGALLLLAGCGGTQVSENGDKSSEKQSSESGSIFSETQKSNDDSEEGNSSVESSVSSATITLEDVMNAPESPAEDFSGSDNGEGGYEITYYNGTDEIVVIPEEIDGLPVVTIAKYTFANDEAGCVRAVRLSDSVVTLKDSCFVNSAMLEIFIAGDSLETIGESAFLNCSSLTTVVLNEGLIEIDELAFSTCSSLTELTIPSTVETMGVTSICFTADDFVLKGAAGSVAESYAEENELTFQTSSFEVQDTYEGSDEGSELGGTSSYTGEEWISIVQSMKQGLADAAVSQGVGYSVVEHTDITLNGVTYNVRRDSSGFVSACLQAYGAFSKDMVWYSGLFTNAGSDSIPGFTKLSWGDAGGWDRLLSGDIISCYDEVTGAGSVAVFAYNSDDIHYVYSCGSTKSLWSAEVVMDNRDFYTTVWRPVDAENSF